MADGQSFLFEGPPDLGQASRISVIVNWTAGLEPAASQRLAAAPRNRTITGIAAAR
jgi:hypothetical protein